MKSKLTLLLAGINSFTVDHSVISSLLGQTSEFQAILNHDTPFPADHYYDLNYLLDKLGIEGAWPEPAEIFNLKRSLLTQKAVERYFITLSPAVLNPVNLKEIVSGLVLPKWLFERIDMIITDEGIIRDNASPGLASVRGEIRTVSASVSRKLTSVLRKAQTDGIVDRETLVSVRNGRGVIPVSAPQRNKISGLIHDQSASGKTIFVEPAEVVALNNRLSDLEHQEKREIIKILSAFAADIRPVLDDLKVNFAIMAQIDYIRAKALLCNRLKCVRPRLNKEPGIDWKEARHPLLYLSYLSRSDKSVVPLDVTLDVATRIILISGPNAGGKSVCLKSVALIQYMLQSGYTVPLSENSSSGIFSSLFIDIGDDQSIDNDLSTYSSHLLNMKYFMRQAGPDTLVLIDEFGAGTEPMLGGAIAEAILVALNSRGVYGVITTHYTNLKHLASSLDGAVNGAMLYDTHLMQPLFRLETGRPGSSFAFEIARKIGLPGPILDDAAARVGEENVDFDRHLKDLLRDKRYWENKRQEIRIRNNKLQETIDRYEEQMSEIKAERRRIVEKAREEAETLLGETNRRIENTIREIRESEAEKKRTREVRRHLEEFKNEVLSLRNQGADNEAGGALAETGSGHKAGMSEKGKQYDPRSRGKSSRQATQVKGGKTSGITPPGPEDIVRIEGTNTTGKIVRIEGKKVTVETDNMIVTVDISGIKKLTHDEIKAVKPVRGRFIRSDPGLSGRKLSFKPERDVRGMRAEEAIEVVRKLVDDAAVVQYPTVRVLHGKGDGILRSVIREYLATLPVVRKFRDEHLESGGTGITVIDLDI
ncbi:MAG: Smr/MutS family protein [Bacteroidales bacterium]|nr:Smr/MutS family protein [Bacteroidales bacterium]